MKPPIMGYIVTRKSGSPLCQGFDASADDPRGGLLYVGRCTTLWPDYEAARNAVARTARYSARHGLSWHQWGWNIIPVRAPGRRPR